MTYIVINTDILDKDGWVVGHEPMVYPTNTDAEVELARKALCAAGLEVAAEYVGEPDGLGDSYASGIPQLHRASGNLFARRCQAGLNDIGVAPR